MKKRSYYALILTALLFIGLVPLSKSKDYKVKDVVVSYVQDNNTLPDQMKQTGQTVTNLSKNNTDVQEGLNTFLNHLYTVVQDEKAMTAEDMARILKAINFAAKKHELQTRKNANLTPYIIHPVGVADHLLYVGKVTDPDILIAALLHDTVEDTNTTFKEIKAIFGDRVEGYVREVTDDKALPYQERKDLQVVHAKDKSSGAAQIKLGDKFYNLRDLLNSPPPSWTKERIDAYFNWAEKVVNGLPLVNEHLKQSIDDIIKQYRENSENN